MRIFRFQRSTDWAVLNADDPVSREFRPPGGVARFSLEGRVEGAYLSGLDLAERMIAAAEG